MTIKNGRNTFLIGLAVYWQSFDLMCPIWAAGLMQHIRGFNRYCLYISILNEEQWMSITMWKYEGRARCYTKEMTCRLISESLKRTNRLRKKVIITSLHIWFVSNFISYIDPNFHNLLCWRLFDSLRLPSLIWQDWCCMKLWDTCFY